MRSFKVKFALSLGLASLLLPSLSWAQTTISVPIEDLPPVRTTLDSLETLHSVGCEAVLSREGIAKVPMGKPLHVAMVQQPGGAFVCPVSAAQVLSLSEGQVGAAVAQAQEEERTWAGWLASWDPTGIVSSAGSAYEASGNLLSALATPANVLIQILEWLGLLGAALVVMSGQLLAVSLSQGTSFVTNGLVITGWPFVLGIANVGFVLGLLYIAFATTLNLQIPGGTRKVLPKLLLAALFINFSLVLTGLVLDFSKILIALILRITGNISDPYEIGAGLMAKSELVESIKGISQGDWWFQLIDPVSGDDPQAARQSTGSWEEAKNLGLVVIFLWGYAISFAFLAIVFFFRYVILLILLILSPLGFLGLALPGMEGLGKKWWTNFIKWTLYGPAAIFVLGLIMGLDSNLFGDAGRGRGFVSGLFPDLAQMVVISILFFVAATSGKFIGAVGSGLAVSFAGGTLRRARRAGTAVPRAVAKPVAKNAKDFAKTGRDAIVSRLTGIKPGEKSIGTRLGEKTFGRPKTKTDLKHEAAQREAGQDSGERLVRSGDPARRVQTAPELQQPKNLRDGNFMKSFKDSHRDALPRLVQHADQTQLSNLVKNTGLAKSMSDSERQQFIINLKNNTKIDVNTQQGRNEQARLINTFQDTVEVADKESREAKDK